MSHNGHKSNVSGAKSSSPKQNLALLLNEIFALKIVPHLLNFVPKTLGPGIRKKADFTRLPF